MELQPDFFGMEKKANLYHAPKIERETNSPDIQSLISKIKTEFDQENVINGASGYANAVKVENGTIPNLDPKVKRETSFPDIQGVISNIKTEVDEKNVINASGFVNAMKMDNGTSSSNLKLERDTSFPDTKSLVSKIKTEVDQKNVISLSGSANAVKVENGTSLLDPNTFFSLPSTPMTDQNPLPSQPNLTPMTDHNSLPRQPNLTPMTDQNSLPRQPNLTPMTVQNPLPRQPYSTPGMWTSCGLGNGIGIAPLTIMYNGTLRTFHVRHDQAQSIFQYAGIVQAISSRNPQSFPSQDKAYFDDVGFRYPSYLNLQQRKKKLERFFEKRKKRLATESPYVPRGNAAEN